MDLDPLYSSIRSYPKDSPERQMMATVSPLLFAMHMDDEITPYPHVRYLDAHVLALKQLRLYHDGPAVTCDVFIRQVEGEGEYEFIGQGYDIAVSDAAYDAAELILARPGSALKYYGRYEEIPEEDRVVTKLGIAMPPRHGKSMIVTEYTPTWFLAHHPDNSVVVSTYNSTFAEKWGKSLQEMIESKGDKIPYATDGQPLTPLTSNLDHTSFRPGKDRGEVNFRGVGGTLTGVGFGLGIIDDPFKDLDDAMSQATRDSRAGWYSSVYQKRKTRRRGSPPPLEIMMFTRWHEDDLAGRFIYDEDDDAIQPGWCMLRLPALAEKNDPLGRAEGESLCPQLKPKSDLLSEQAVDPKVFEALNQGRPQHEKGGMIAKTRELPNGEYAYFHHLDKGDYYARTDNNNIYRKDEGMFYTTMDLAASKRTTADWTVISLWFWHGATRTLILVDRKRDRVSTETHRQFFLDFLALHPLTPAVFNGIENKSFGTNLINELRVSEPGLLIVPLEAEHDKITRTIPYAEAIKTGHVLFPCPSVWHASTVWENEHSRFSAKCKHDDQVDTGAYAWRKAQDYVTLERPPQQVKEPTIQEKCMAQLKRKTEGEHDYVGLRRIMEELGQ